MANCRSQIRSKREARGNREKIDDRGWMIEEREGNS